MTVLLVNIFQSLMTVVNQNLALASGAVFLTAVFVTALGGQVQHVEPPTRAASQALTNLSPTWLNLVLLQLVGFVLRLGVARAEERTHYTCLTKDYNYCGAKPETSTGMDSNLLRLRGPDYFTHITAVHYHPSKPARKSSSQERYVAWNKIAEFVKKKSRPLPRAEKITTPQHWKQKPWNKVFIRETEINQSSCLINRGKWRMLAILLHPHVLLLVSHGYLN